MSSKTDRIISIVDAARLIFRTRNPTDEQIHRVYTQMKSRALAVHDSSGPPLKWLTTEEAVADFLAANKIEQTLGHPAIAAAKQRAKWTSKDAPSSLPPNYEEESEMLREVYHGIWKEYFLAVILRRRAAHHSKKFRRTVVVGQAVLLVGMLGRFFGTFRLAFQPTPPERLVIERWIDENTDDYSITRWHSSKSLGGAVVVRVEYRYQKDSRRSIHTDRTFSVQGEVVTEVSDDAGE
jgi:hypothetical protein